MIAMGISLINVLAAVIWVVAVCPARFTRPVAGGDESKPTTATSASLQDRICEENRLWTTADSEGSRCEMADTEEAIQAVPVEGSTAEDTPLGVATPPPSRAQDHQEPESMEMETEPIALDDPADEADMSQGEETEDMDVTTGDDEVKEGAISEVKVQEEGAISGGGVAGDRDCGSKDDKIVDSVDPTQKGGVVKAEEANGEGIVDTKQEVNGEGDVDTKQEVNADITDGGEAKADEVSGEGTTRDASGEGEGSVDTTLEASDTTTPETSDEGAVDTTKQEVTKGGVDTIPEINIEEKDDINIPDSDDTLPLSLDDVVPTLPTLLSMPSEESEEEEEEEIGPFPDNLKAFKYDFDENGKLKHIETGDDFQFEVKKGQRRYNQAHYEALGDVITEKVYELLETKGNLKRQYLPVDAEENEVRSFFFLSEDALTCDKLLILIHGSGAVRAGQWARSLIINHSLDSGTQLPYIERGMKEGYGVMVLNTNLNYQADKDGRQQPIRENASPQEHASYVWKEFVQESKAKRINIVAHSFGGVVTVDLMCDKFTEFKGRVHKIAFTDSVHSIHSHRVTMKKKKWIIKHSCNWVSSSEELDTPQHSYYFGDDDDDIQRVSAGTPKHVETSWRAFESVFKYFSKVEGEKK